jgi:hypothetical protein
MLRLLYVDNNEINLKGKSRAMSESGAASEVPASSIVDSEVLTPERAGARFIEGLSKFIDGRPNDNRSFAGRTLTADFSGGKFRVRHTFHDDGITLTWEVLTGEEAGQNGRVPYKLFALRPGLALVMMRPLEHESVFLVVDDKRGIAAGILGRAGLRDSSIAMKRLWGPILESESGVNARAAVSPCDLGGSRFTVAYANGAAIYEHIYLNQHYMTWLGHKGTSAGVADTERYEAIAIAPFLYLVGWNEKAAPIQISFLFDFEQMLEHAAVLGVAPGGKPAYGTTTARIVEISHSRLPELETAKR